jgi:predicted amidohydrolase
MAAARTNRMAVACCDRGGTERGIEWTSGTSIISADGWVVADSSECTLVIASLDLELATDKQISNQNNLFGDLRGDIYGP